MNPVMRWVEIIFLPSVCEFMNECCMVLDQDRRRIAAELCIFLNF